MAEPDIDKAAEAVLQDEQVVELQDVLAAELVAGQKARLQAWFPHQRKMT